MSKEGDEQRRPRWGPYGKPCEACRHRRRMCKPDCLSKPYFPSGKEFKAKFTAVDRLFGHREFEKKLLAKSREERDTAARTMIAQALLARAEDSILGLTGDMDKLIGEVITFRVEFEHLNDLLEQLHANESFKATFQDLQDIQDIIRTCPELSLHPPTIQLQQQNLQDGNHQNDRQAKVNGPTMESSELPSPFPLVRKQD